MTRILKALWNKPLHFERIDWQWLCKLICEHLAILATKKCWRSSGTWWMIAITAAVSCTSAGTINTSFHCLPVGTLVWCNARVCLGCFKPDAFICGIAENIEGFILPFLLYQNKLIHSSSSRWIPGFSGVLTLVAYSIYRLTKWHAMWKIWSFLLCQKS